MKNDDVLEATAALKGMLGIGNGGDRIKDPKDRTNNSASPNQNMNKEVKKSSKKKTKKKKTSLLKNSNDEISDKNQNQQGNRRNKSKKNSSEGHNTPPNTQTSKAKKKENSNFAWSAFQSPPDASSLPLPAFSGADLFSKVSNSRKDEPHEEKTENLSLPLNAVIKSAEQFENEIISAAEAKAGAKKNEEDCQDADNSRDEDNDVTKESESETGVNLAAIASSSLAKKDNNSTERKDSFPSLLNPSKTSRLGLDNIQPKSQQIYNNGFLRPQHHQQQFSQQHQIVTIQVQVPPVLLAGRQMMVHTPAGYPIPVVVPENVQPGMIIPVNVPAPINFHHLAQIGGHPPQLMQHHQQQQQPMNNIAPSPTSSSPMNRSQYQNNVSQQQHNRTPHVNLRPSSHNTKIGATRKKN